MTAVEAAAAAIADTFPTSPLHLASTATGIPPAILRAGLRGKHPFTLAELHLIAIATGRRTVDLLGGE